MDSPYQNGNDVVLDIKASAWKGQEYRVPTSHGPLSVFVCGDQDRPALITYPDLTLDCDTCFEGLFLCEEAGPLFQNFRVYHISIPSGESRTAATSPESTLPSLDDLAEQVAEVCDYFRLQEVICLGVVTGAYILTLFTLKFKHRVQGLILVSPVSQPPSWKEWFYNKAMINVLYFCGMCKFVKETLMQRYFSQEFRTSLGLGTTMRLAYDLLFTDKESGSIMRLLRASHQRKDLSLGLKQLQCRTLIFVGELSPFYHEAIHINSEMNRGQNALVEVQACGSLVTAEQPHAMLVPIEYFLMGFGFFKGAQLGSQSSSPTSPLSPPCISPELLSPESLGLKLKPIKTRVSFEAN